MVRFIVVPRVLSSITCSMALTMICVWLLPSVRAMAEPQDALPAIEVDVRKVDGGIVIDGSFLVPVPPREAWNVLTDYEHMPQFMRSVKTSKIILTSPEKIRVAQTGGASRGILSFGFEVVREVRMMPYTEIVSKVISGNLKKSDSITRLIPETGGTRVLLHSESIPNIWVPPGIGPALINSEMTAQFGDLRAEILRRNAAAKAR
jgi:hypothetical protein